MYIYPFGAIAIHSSTLFFPSPNVTWYQSCRVRSVRHPRHLRCTVPGRIDLPSRGRHLPLAPNPFPFFLVESSQQQQPPLHSPPAVVESSSIRSREGSSSPSPSWIRRRRPLSAAHRGASSCAVARRSSAPSWPPLPPVQPSAGRGSRCWRWPLSSSRGRRCSSSRIRPPQIRPSRIQRRVRCLSPARPPRASSAVAVGAVPTRPRHRAPIRPPLLTPPVCRECSVLLCICDNCYAFVLGAS